MCAEREGKPRLAWPNRPREEKPYQYFRLHLLDQALQHGHFWNIVYMDSINFSGGFMEITSFCYLDR